MNLIEHSDEPCANQFYVNTENSTKIASPTGTSHFVNRSRQIRRKTTNVYFEELQQLDSTNSFSLIRQILIIKLKNRSEASEYEQRCVNYSDSTATFIPSVDFSYPSLNAADAEKFPPPLFYPDFTKSAVMRREEGPEAFIVVLTNTEGKRTFAYCYKYLDTTDEGNHGRGKFCVLVFASIYCYENVFLKLASNFVSSLHQHPSLIQEICADVMDIKPTQGIDQLKDNDGSFRHANSNLSSLCEKIGLENAVLIFLALLAERRIIITGTNVAEVSQSVQTFVRMLFPLEWPHALIPIIPDSLTGLCFNPTPYIYGILRYNLSLIKELISQPVDRTYEILLFDMERGFVIPHIPMKKHKNIGLTNLIEHSDSIGFPKSLVCELLTSLRS